MVLHQGSNPFGSLRYPFPLFQIGVIERHPIGCQIEEGSLGTGSLGALECMVNEVLVQGASTGAAGKSKDLGGIGHRVVL